MVILSWNCETMYAGDESMYKEGKKEKKSLQPVLYVFPAAGIGALLGLLAYVKGWL